MNNSIKPSFIYFSLIILSIWNVCPSAISAANDDCIDFSKPSAEREINKLDLNGVRSVEKLSDGVLKLTLSDRCSYVLRNSALLHDVHQEAFLSAILRNIGVPTPSVYLVPKRKAEELSKKLFKDEDPKSTLSLARYAEGLTKGANYFEKRWTRLHFLLAYYLHPNRPSLREKYGNSILDEVKRIGINATELVLRDFELNTPAQGTQFLYQILKDAGPSGPAYVAKAVRNVYQNVPGEIRNQLSKYLLILGALGYQDLHSSNWLIDIDTQLVSPIDLAAPVLLFERTKDICDYLNEIVSLTFFAESPLSNRFLYPLVLQDIIKNKLEILEFLKKIDLDLLQKINTESDSEKSSKYIANTVKSVELTREWLSEL